MSKFSFVLMLMFTASETAAEECIYDQDAQIQKLHEIGHQQKAALNLSERTLTWTEPDGRQLTIAYGGCDHLGFTVRMTLPDSAFKNEADAMQVAKSLAQRFWDKAEYEQLNIGLAAGNGKREQMGETVSIQLPAEHYSEFYIEYAIPARFVEIAWVRNF